MNPFGAEITKTSDNPPMAVVQQQMVDPSNPFGAPITKTGQVSPGTSQGPVSPPVSPTEPVQLPSVQPRESFGGEDPTGGQVKMDIPGVLFKAYDTVRSLAEGAIGWGMGKGLKFTYMAKESIEAEMLKDLMKGDHPTTLDVKYKALIEQGYFDPQAITERSRQLDEATQGLFYKPQTEFAQHAVETVMKPIEWVLGKTAKPLGEKVGEVDPRLGDLVEFGTELALFKVAHRTTRPLTNATKRVAERIKKNYKANPAVWADLKSPEARQAYIRREWEKYAKEEATVDEMDAINEMLKKSAEPEGVDRVTQAREQMQAEIDKQFPPEDPVDRVAELRRNDEIIREQEGYEPPAPEPAPKTIPRVGEYPLHKAQKPPKIPDKMPTQETPAQKILREMEERIAEKKKSREVPIETPVVEEPPVKRGPVETPTLTQKPSIGPQVPKPTPPEQIKSVRELPLSEDGYIDFDRAYEWLEVELQDRYENFNPKTATVIDRAAVRAMEGKPLTLPQQRKLSKWYEEEVKTEKFDPELNRMRRGLEPFESKTVRPRELWDELGLERIGESVDYGITEASLKKQAIDAVNRDYSGKAKAYLLSRIEELWTERQKFNNDYESLWKRIINNERGEVKVSGEDLKNVLRDAGFFEREIRNGVSENRQQEALSGKVFQGSQLVPVTKEMIEGKRRLRDEAKTKLKEAEDILSNITEEEFWEGKYREKLLHNDARGGMSDVIPSLKTFLKNKQEGLDRYQRQYDRGKGLLGNERGEITISPEARSKLSEYIKKARVKGVPLNQYLRNEGFSDQHSKTLSDLADGIMKEDVRPSVASSNEAVIKTHEELRENILETGDLTSKQGVQILSFGRQIETASQTFHELGKKMRETFYRPIKYAEKAEIVEKAEYKKTLNHLFRGVNRNSRRKIGINLIADQKNVGVWDKKVVHGRDALREMGIDHIPALSPKELEVKSKIRDHMEQFYEDVNAAREAAGMKPFPYRENYFTFMRDMNKLDSVLMSGGNGTNPLAMDVKSLRQLFFEHKRTPGFRFAKRRHIDKIGLELDPLRVMKRYGDSAIHFKNIAPVTARLSDLLKPKKMDIVGSDGTVRQGKWSLADDAPLANRMLRDWVDFQAGKVPPTRVPHAIDNALRKINRNLAWAVLSYNFRSALIQPTALKNTYLKIGAGYTIEGILEAANPKSIMMARQKSNVLRGRAFQDVSVKDAMDWAKSKPFAGVRATTGKIGMMPLQALDYMTATATWIGAYRKALKAGKNEKSAIDYADDVVTDTQASGAKSDISPLQRSNIGKTMSLFQTFVINDWNFLMNDVLQYKKSNVNGIRAKQVMRLMAATAAINFIYEEMLNTNSPYPTPYKAFDEALEDWDRAGDDNQIKQFPRSVYAAMQIGKELAEYVPVAGGGIRYGSSIPAAFSEVQKLLNENDWTSILKLGGISGTNQILKTLRAVEAGETDPWTLSVGLGPEYYRDQKTKSSSIGLRKPSSALKGLKTLKSLEP